MTRTTTLVWALTAFLLVGAGACGSDATSDVTAVHDVTDEAALSTLTLHVRGMT